MTKKEEAQQKKKQKLEAEKARVAAMRSFERDAVAEYYGTSFFPELASDDETVKESVLICGVDEAGRGPLAGPVCAAACILPVDHDILWINDSKKLSAKKREELYDVITKEAIAFGVGFSSAQLIDEINILQATYEAMRSAIDGLSVKPQVLINDAVTIPEMKIPQVPVIKGDAKCLCVAAASIIAKVTRDRLMIEMDALYPEYGFAAHKGYGTKAHIEAIQKYGPCPIHRETFITHFI